MLGSGTGGSGAAVVALPPSAVASAAAPVASAEQPVAVVAEPLAATVADPVQTPAASGCVVLVRDEEVACTANDDGLQFTVCVPEATSLIRVGSRPNDRVSFGDASSTIALGGASTCPAGEIAADVAIDSYSPVATWRIVGRDASDQKIWKSRVVAQSPSP